MTNDGTTLTDIRSEIKELGDRLETSMAEKLGGIKDDLAMVKGRYAIDVTLDQLPLIADSLGMGFLNAVSREELISLASNLPASSDTPSEGDIASFKKAGAVMRADDQGRIVYVANEASYTVQKRDVDRATRNAGYLGAITGYETCALVSGVDVTPRARRAMERHEVSYYPLERRHFEAE